MTTIACFSKAHSFIRWNLYTASALIKIFSDRLYSFVGDKEYSFVVVRLTLKRAWDMNALCAQIPPVQTVYVVTS